MIVTRSSMDQVWTDLSSPTKDELDSLILSQNLDPLIAKDLLAPTPRQYAEKFGQAIYAVIHIPSFNHSHKQSYEQEIDLIVTKKGLITARYESIDPLHHFAKQIEVSEILNKGHNTHLLFGLSREIYKSLSDELEYAKDWMKEIEKHIFSGHEKEMVFSISEVGRNLLNFKRVIGSHESVWHNLAKIGEENFGEDFKKEADLVLEECQRLTLEIKNVSEVLVELRETNNSILSTKQNEIMKIFTILAFVTFPLSLIAAIFGMNTVFIPIVGLPNDFWIVIALMILISIAMFGYFKYKKWI